MVMMSNSNHHNKEINVRRRISGIYNKREEDFPSLKDYNDYLEEMECMDGINVEAIEEKLKRYSQENAEHIMVNRARKAEELTAACKAQPPQTNADTSSNIGVTAGTSYNQASRATGMRPQPVPIGFSSRVLIRRFVAMDSSRIDSAKEEYPIEAIYVRSSKSKENEVMENGNSFVASSLIQFSPHEIENQLELSLRHAFNSLKPKLQPPFSLEIPDPQEYIELNKAIVYGVLCDSSSSKTHIKHLHAFVTDGYAFFTSLLVGIVVELYDKLVDSAKLQLLWVTKEMISVSSVGLEDLLVCLLRRIGSGDYSDQNVWQCSELVRLFLDHWDCLLEDFPLVLTSALYSFLRLLADHCRVSCITELENVKRLEIKFCVKMFKEQLHLSLKIGRDLVRLLQDLLHVSVFREIWNGLVSDQSFDISQIYQSKTSSRYFLLRITPEMETQLRFLLGNVKLGSHKRHQIWFLRRFLMGHEKETLLVDIIRFICCCIHPTNEIIRSDIMPRWAIIGWLLELCRQNHHIEQSVKLALFYDWLFFDGKIENIMNVEPAALLMVWSIPQYPHITHSLLDFLLHLVDTYDINRRNMIVRGVASAFREIERKGVVQSLDMFLSSNAIAPELKKKLANLLSCHQEE